MSNAGTRASIQSFLAGRIFLSTSMAAWRTSESLSFNAVVRAGTASFAAGPILPSASAAAHARLRSSSFKTAISLGTAFVSSGAIESIEFFRLSYSLTAKYRDPSVKPPSTRINTASPTITAVTLRRVVRSSSVIRLLLLFSNDQRTPQCVHVSPTRADRGTPRPHVPHVAPTRFHSGSGTALGSKSLVGSLHTTQAITRERTPANSSGLNMG
jgi:hypothetical protein